MNPQMIFLCFVLLTLSVKLYLGFKNTLFIKSHWSEVPKRFAADITLDEHQKSIEYHGANFKFSLFNLFLDLVLLFAWTFGGGIDYLYNLVKVYELSFIKESLLFIAGMSVVSYVIGLPMSLYHTFVIEEKFGFNKTTPKTFFIDQIKGLVLSLVLGLPLMWVILFLLEKYQYNWWIFTFIVLSSYQLLIMWLYPKVIAPLFNKFEPLEDGELKDKIFSLLDTINLKFKSIFIMDASKRTSHGNAYFTGFGKNRTIVLFDTLLKNISNDQALAVLAHELGHLKHKHILKSMVLSFTLSFITLYIMSIALQSEWFYSMHGVESQNLFLGLVIFSMVMGQYTFLSTPVFSFFSRKNEFEADEFAAKHSSAEDLIQALIRLYKDNSSPVITDATYANFYYSHPPASIRIDALEKFIPQKKED